MLGHGFVMFDRRYNAIDQRTGTLGIEAVVEEFELLFERQKEGIMGFLLVCIGVQFVANGIAEFVAKGTGP